MKTKLGFEMEQKEPEEILTLKFAMLQRGLKSKALAAKAKLHVRVVHNVLAGNNKTWPPRAAINRALRSKIFQQPTDRRTRSRKHT